MFTAPAKYIHSNFGTLHNVIILLLLLIFCLLLICFVIFFFQFYFIIFITATFTYQALQLLVFFILHLHTSLNQQSTQWAKMQQRFISFH